jgi:ATP-dependent DNA helicase RecG
MKTLKMGVDVSGKGIGFIYQKQIDKYFPIPDFISRNEGDYEEIFVLRIYGKVIDKKFSEILRNHPSFDIPKIILLDKIQKGLGNEIDENDVKKLQKEKLIEGRKPNYILSMKVAEILGEEVEYTRRKGFSDDEVIDIIIKHLKNFPNGKSRLQIDELAEKYLSTTLNSDKKRAKIKYILSKMKKKNLIKNFGSDKKPFYKLIL